MRTSLKLSFASAVNERTRPLIEGEVRPQGIELIPTVSHPSETFWRQLKHEEFDISEMSLSSYIIAKSRGSSLVAIPAFPSRRLFHTELDCHVDAGIREPTDLAGKRVGVPEYQQTAAVWLRGVLHEDFGVDARDIHWFMERTEGLSHGGATGFEPPEGVVVDRVPPEKSLVSMLFDREIDAALVRPNRRVELSSPIERSNRAEGGDWSRIVPAFRDGIAEGRRFIGKHGYLPINHTYVIRSEVLEAHPWVALNVYKAFLEAKKLAEANLFDSIPLSLVFRWEHLWLAQEVFGPDPFPYGLEANRPVLERIVRMLHQQGLVDAPLGVDELFHPATAEWE